MGSRAARAESTSRNGQPPALASLVGGLPLTMTRALGIPAWHVRDVGHALKDR